jgi:hypothetical protein
MDQGHFDDLTRSMGRGGDTRRAILRLLAGGALGGMVARLGLVEVTEAKPKHEKEKRKQQRRPQAEHKGHGQLHAEGKGKKKKRHKKPKEPLPLPPGCAFCNDCQMCQDGACVPDPALDGVRCLASGAACGYCQSGQCTASALPPCPDGTCLQRGQCCPGEKKCPDPTPGSPTGYACVGLDDCCPDQKKCAGGCVYKQACCPEERPQCGQCGEICVNGTWRCSAQKPCADGSCVAQDACCGGDCGSSSVCCQGTCCDRYQGGGVFTCSRDGCCNQWFLCNDGRCDPRCFYDSCDPPELCPDLPPPG